MSWLDIKEPTIESNTIAKAQIRSDFEAGYVQSRAKWSKSRRKFRLSWQEGRCLKNDEKQILETHFDDNLGGSFSWSHSQISGEFTVIYSNDTVDFKLEGPGIWSTTIELEEL